MEGHWVLPKQIAKLNIPDGAKLVLSILTTLFNADVLEFPTRQYISDNLNISLESVDRHLKALKICGLLPNKKLNGKNVKLSEMIGPHIYNIYINKDNNCDLSKTTTSDEPKTHSKEYKEIENYFVEEYKRLFGNAPAMTYGDTRNLLKRYLNAGIKVETIQKVVKEFLVDVKYWEGDVKFRPSPSFRSLLGEKQFNKYLAKIK